MIGPGGIGAAHSSAVCSAVAAFARSVASLNHVRASSSEVHPRTSWSIFSKSKSKPASAKAPEKNQSTVCATCATTDAAVYNPGAGTKAEFSSLSERVERLK